MEINTRDFSNRLKKIFLFFRCNPFEIHNDFHLSVEFFGALIKLFTVKLCIFLNDIDEFVDVDI